MIHSILHHLPIWLYTKTPFIITALALAGAIWFLTLFLMWVVTQTSKTYGRLLREWTPSGWYYSLVILISDLPRLKTSEWQLFHVQKLSRLLIMLRTSNPVLYGMVIDEVTKASVKLNKEKQREAVKPHAGL